MSETSIFRSRRRSSSRARRPRAVLRYAWPALLVFALSCRREEAWPRLRARAGADSRILTQRIAGQVFVATDRGNLASGIAANGAQREQRLAEFLRDFRRELGLNGDLASMQYRALVPETPITIGSQVLQTIYLAPVYRGAVVIDRVQSAAFDSASGTLRSVLARAVDFATLPQPPAPDPAARARAQQVVMRRLLGNEPPSGSVTVGADPVISAELRRAGYVVDYRARAEGGAGRWVRALFDPAANAVFILRQEERDDLPMPTGRPPR